MNRFYGKDIFASRVSPKNWEDNVDEVCVEACDCQEDPLGYRAVFVVRDSANKSVQSFTVGASFLAKRQENLLKGGYMAPMTGRAIELIENKIGHGLQSGVF